MKTHIRPFPHATALLAALSLIPTLAIASEWEIDGSTTVHLGHYRINGDRANSPWQFSGGHHYGEFGINLLRRESAYESWRGQILGVVNASDYRSRDKGFVPERLSLIHEKGDGSLPFRAEYGDHLAYFSYLTQQGTQKGVLLDLQPHAARPDRQHSIMLTAGEVAPSWRDLDIGKDSIVGASWLMADERLGNFGFNAVFSHRDRDSSLALPTRKQTVSSLAWHKGLRLGELNLAFETEAALFNGEHNGTLDSPAGRRHSDTGFFGEVTGSHRTHPFGFRLRTEHYGEHFRPRGAVVTPDRRSYEAHASWRTRGGLSLRGRAQRFRDDAESSNPRDTDTLGVSLSGNLLGAWIPGVTGNVNAYTQDIESRDKVIDSTIRVFNADVSKQLTPAWTGRAGVYLQNTDDHSAAALDQQIRQISLSGSSNFRFAGFAGMVTPGVQYRRIRGAGERHEWNPTLSVIGRRGPHQINFSYGYFNQNLSGGDTLTQTLRMGYRYAVRRHTFGIDIDLFDRDQQAVPDTDAQIVRLFWTYSFDNRSARRAATSAAPLAPATRIGADVVALAPGLSFVRARSAIEREGLGDPARFGPYSVFEYRMFNNVDQRQRLALGSEAGTLKRSALIIEFDDIGNTDTVNQTYLRVRKAVLDRYGSPARIYEKGDFGPSPVSDINSQEVVRILEWDTESGVMRFGIPQRYDGIIRMELQHARRFPDFLDGFWSIDNVR